MNTTHETGSGAGADGARGAAFLRHPVAPGPEHLEAASAALRRPAEPIRLGVLWQLTPGPRSVGELVEGTGAARTVVSQHLGKLRLSGMVRAHEQGRHVIYSLPDGRPARLIQEIVKHTDHRITGEPVHD